MRSSSIKSLVAVLSVSFTVAIAVPRAEARPSQPQRVSQTAQTQAGALDRMQRSVAQLIQRVFSIRTNGDLPSIPIPEAVAGTNVPTIDPKKQR